MKKSSKPSAPVNPDQLSLDAPVAWVVYVLCDPRETDPVQRIRYVGVTTQRPMARFGAHMSRARHGSEYHVSRWIRKLLSDGVYPSMEVIDPGIEQRVFGSAESKWISYYRGLGCILTNITDGGEGGRGHKFSDESRAKMSATRRKMGQRPSQLAIDNARKAVKGKRLSDDHRAKISQANKGRCVSDEARQAMSDSQRKRQAREKEQRSHTC